MTVEDLVLPLRPYINSGTGIEEGASSRWNTKWRSQVRRLGNDLGGSKSETSSVSICWRMWRSRIQVQDEFPL